MSFCWTYGSMTPEAKIRRTSRSRRSGGTRPGRRGTADTHEEALSGLQLNHIIAPASVNAIDGVGGEI